jgi:hypothetical protein
MSETKTCSRCNVEKDITLFCYYKCWRKGITYVNPCKECNNAAERVKKQKQRAEKKERMANARKCE